MSARKSGSSIYVEGSPNTLSSITADIGDNTWIAESPSGTFTIKNKDIDIRDGGVLTIGDSGDYSVSKKLNLQPSASTGCNFTIQKGGELQLFGNVEIDATTNPSYYQYWYFYGKFYVRGNATYKPTLKHVHRIYRYWNSYAPTYDRNHDVFDVDYLKIINPFNTVSYYLYLQDLYYAADKDVESWKNIEFGEAGDTSGYIIFGSYSIVKAVADDFSKLQIEDCKFQYANSYGMLIVAFPIHFKNSLFANNGSNGLRSQYDLATHNQVRGKAGSIAPRNMDIQQFVFCEGCDFENNGSYDVHLRDGVSFLTKDSTYNYASYGIYSDYGSRVYIWSGNTFNGSNPVNLSARNLVFWVNALDLTVKSKSSGNPLEDAMVYCRQKDGKEELLFRTDSAGKPINMAGLDGKIILIHKEQLNSAATSWDLWSDPGNSTYHEIWIWKEGYEPAKLTYTMNADRTITVELEDALVEAEVEKPVPFGLGLTGSLSVDYPVIGDVEKGVSYDSGAKVGNFKVPVENKVEQGEKYGALGTEFTGTLLAVSFQLPLVGVLRDKINLTGTLRKT